MVLKKCPNRDKGLKKGPKRVAFGSEKANRDNGPKRVPRGSFLVMKNGLNRDQGLKKGQQRAAFSPEEGSVVKYCEHLLLLRTPT